MFRIFFLCENRKEKEVLKLVNASIFPILRISHKLSTYPDLERGALSRSHGKTLRRAVFVL